MSASGLEVVVPVSAEQGQAALTAFWRFGRSFHPAALNFGDCFVYALARLPESRFS